MKKGEKEAPKAKQPNPPPFGSKGVEAGTDPRGPKGARALLAQRKKFFGPPGPKKKREIFLLV